MKIKCPACGADNYFTGLEDEVTKFCSNCNRPLPEPKIPDTTENLYIKNKKEGINTAFLESKKTLDKESFSNVLIEWVVESLKTINITGQFQWFSKKIVGLFGADKVTKGKFTEEIYYLYIWLAYINSTPIFQNKNKISVYFYYFIEKMYDLFLKIGFNFGGYKKEEWGKNQKERLNGYIDAYNFSIKNKNFSPLGREFYKNLYGGEVPGFTNETVFTVFVVGELEISFKTLGKELTKYKI